MADLDVTIGLDYNQYKRGLREVEASSSRTSEVITRSFRLDVLRRGVQTAFNYAGDSIREFSKANADAQRVHAEWLNFDRPIKMGIGRDLAGGMADFNQSLKDAVSYLERIRTLTVNAVAFPLRKAFGADGTGAEIDALRSERGDIEREATRQRQAFQDSLSLRKAIEDDRARAKRDSSGPEGDFEAASLEAAGRATERHRAVSEGKYYNTAERAELDRLIREAQVGTVSAAAEVGQRRLHELADQWRSTLRVRALEPGTGTTAFGRSGLFSRAFAGPDEERELRGRANRLQEDANKTLKAIEQNTQRITARAG